MELALNFVWLGISCALLVLGIPLIRSQSGARSRWCVAIGLVCILCLLFPVISMTDDLHNTPAVIENKKLKTLVAVGHVIAALLTRVSLQAPSLAALGVQGCEKLLLPIAALLTFDLSRRPPPMFLSSLFV